MDKRFIRKFENGEFCCPFCSNGYLLLYHHYQYNGKIASEDSTYYLECPTCLMLYVSGQADEEAISNSAEMFKTLTNKTRDMVNFYLV